MLFRGKAPPRSARIYDEGGPKHFDPSGNIVTDTWSEYDGMNSAIKYGHTEVLRMLEKLERPAADQDKRIARRGKEEPGPRRHC